MGSLADGVDRRRRADWLAERHVHRQEPCGTCWARYLCGGGCHHEVIRRGRPACDYIRGWLHYCLEAYLRLSARTDLSAGPATGRLFLVETEKVHADDDRHLHHRRRARRERSRGQAGPIRVERVPGGASDISSAPPRRVVEPGRYSAPGEHRGRSGD